MPRLGLRLSAIALAALLATASAAPAQFITGRIGPVGFTIVRDYPPPFAAAYPPPGYAPPAYGGFREEVYSPYLAGIRQYNYSPYGGVRSYTYDAFPPDFKTNNPFLRPPVNPSAASVPAGGGYDNPGWQVDPQDRRINPPARPRQPDPDLDPTPAPAQPRQPAAREGPASLTVLMPTEDAELFFDTTKTTRRGTTRAFQTPALKIGTDYAYTLTARWQEGGKPRTASRRVDLRAGDRITIDLRDPEPTE